MKFNQFITIFLLLKIFKFALNTNPDQRKKTRLITTFKQIRSDIFDKLKNQFNMPSRYLNFFTFTIIFLVSSIVLCYSIYKKLFFIAYVTAAILMLDFIFLLFFIIFYRFFSSSKIKLSPA